MEEQIVHDVTYEQLVALTLGKGKDLEYLSTAAIVNDKDTYEGWLIPGDYYKFLYKPDISSQEPKDSYENCYDFQDYIDQTTNWSEYHPYHYFCLTVQATSLATLSVDATASAPRREPYGYYSDQKVIWPHICYFEQTDFSKWVVLYTISNDSNKFSWASEKSTGTIYYLKDEFNNSAHFDFKNYRIYDKHTGLYFYLFDLSYYEDIMGKNQSLDCSVRHGYPSDNEQYPEEYDNMPIVTQRMVPRQIGDDEFLLMVNVFDNTVEKFTNDSGVCTLPTSHFEATYDYLTKFLSIARNRISSNCKNATLVNCYNCNNMFTYYAYYVEDKKARKNYIIDFNKTYRVYDPLTKEYINVNNEDYTFTFFGNNYSLKNINDSFVENYQQDCIFNY